MFLKYILPGLSWAIFILILCGLPTQNIAEVNFWDILKPDKLFHFGLFSVLSVVLMVGFKRQYSFPKLRCNSCAVAVVLSVLYGIIIEGIQIVYFDGREGEMLDVLANTLGALFGYVIFKIIYGNTRISAS